MNASAMARTYRRPPSDYDEFSCPRRCNEAYYPLCGVNKAGDTKVFTNDCYMSMENCNQLPQQGLLSISQTFAICYSSWILTNNLLIFSLLWHRRH